MENNEDKKEKAYVAAEITLRELEKLAQEISNDPYNKKYLYEYKVDIGEISQQQSIIQTANKWYAEQNLDMRMGEDTIYRLIKTIAYSEIFNGTKEKLQEVVREKVMNTTKRAIVIFREFDDKRTRMEIDSEIEGEYKDKYEYSYDTNEMEKRFKDVVLKGYSRTAEVEYVMLEKVSIGIYSYSFRDLGEKVDKLIKKFIRNELTYCIKSGKIIIPEEYIKKGEDGIKEWREVKSASNKNNSIEKRMIKQVFTEKRQYANRAMYQVMGKIMSTHCDWSLPCITVDGRWNQTKTRKLVTKLADTKNKQKFMDMTKEEINKKFKDYWKNVLMDIYREVDEMEIKDE